MTDEHSEPRRPLLGVSTAVFREASSGIEVLLVERGAQGALAGRLSLPGGKVRLGERLAEAAARELFEETGLSFAAEALSRVRLHEAIGEGYHAVIAVHAVRCSHDRPPRAGDDAASAAFHPLHAVQDLEVADRTTPGLPEIVAKAASVLGLKG
ncbi:MAG: NUDIX domain-containing protein [Pseudomonadota bacterium]|nr:NUDIX domain-containing protein [Pseudomonadota bacterium]